MAKKPDFWEYPLGADADVNVLDRDLDNTKGDATLRGLFPVLTSTRLKDGGIPPQRKDLNALFKLIGENIYFLQHGGFYVWDENITYDKDAIVLKDGILFQAQLQTEGADPLTNTGIWKKLIEVSADDIKALRDALPKSATSQTEGLVVLSNAVDANNNTSAITPAGVAPLKANIDALDERVTNVYDTIDELTGGSATAVESINEMKKDIDTLKSNDVRQDGDISTLNEQVETLTNRVDGLDAFDAGALTGRVQVLESAVDEKENEIRTLDTKIEGNTTEIEGMKSSVNSALGLIADVSRNTTKINDLETSINKVESDIAETYSGVMNYAETEEYGEGAIVTIPETNKLYQCIQEITKTGRPVGPERPAENATQEEKDAYNTALEAYLRDLDAWLNQSTGVDISDRSYWLPLNDVPVYRWSNTGFYKTGDIVIYNHKLYEALQDHAGTSANIGNGNVWREITSSDKTIGIFEYNKTQTFVAGSIVLGSDNILYKAKSNTVGNDPVTSPTYWIAISSVNTGSEGGEATTEDVLRSLESLQTAVNSKPDAGVYSYTNDKSYGAGDIVFYNDLLWKATQSTQGHAPADNSEFFIRLNNKMRHNGEDFVGIFKFNASGVTYKKDEIVEYGGQLYKSLSDNNLGVNPSGSNTWQRLCPPASDDAVIKELKNDILDCETANNTQDTRLDALEAFKNEVGTLDVDAINSSIDSLETKLNNADIPNLRERITALEGADNSADVASLKTDVSDLKAFKTQQEATNTAYANKFNDVDATVASVAELPQTVSALSTKVDNIEKTIPADRSSDIDALQTKDTDLENRLGTLEETVQGLSEGSETNVDTVAFNALKGRVDTMEPKVQKNVTDIGALDTRVTTLEGKTENILTTDVLDDYAKKSDIPEVPDMSTVALKSDLSTYAKKSDIPDVSNFVENSDLEGLAKAEDIPDVSVYAKSADVETTYAKKTDLADYAKKSDIPSGSGSSGGSSAKIGRFFLNTWLGDDYDGLVDVWYTGEEGAISSVTIDATNGLVFNLVDGKLLSTITVHLMNDFSAFAPHGVFLMPIYFKHDKTENDWNVSQELYDEEGNPLSEHPEYHVIPSATWMPANSVTVDNFQKVSQEAWFDLNGTSDMLQFKSTNGSTHTFFDYTGLIDVFLKISL